MIQGTRRYRAGPSGSVHADAPGAPVTDSGPFPPLPCLDLLDDGGQVSRPHVAGEPEEVLARGLGAREKFAEPAVALQDVAAPAGRH